MFWKDLILRNERSVEFLVLEGTGEEWSVTGEAFLQPNPPDVTPWVYGWLA